MVKNFLIISFIVVKWLVKERVMKRKKLILSCISSVNKFFVYDIMWKYKNELFVDVDYNELYWVIVILLLLFFIKFVYGLIKFWIKMMKVCFI